DGAGIARSDDLDQVRQLVDRLSGAALADVLQQIHSLREDRAGEGVRSRLDDANARGEQLLAHLRHPQLAGRDPPPAPVDDAPDQTPDAPPVLLAVARIEMDVEDAAWHSRTAQGTGHVRHVHVPTRGVR